MASAWYPLLLAGFPILGLYAVNYQEVSGTDVASVLATCFATTAVVLLLFRFVYGCFDRAAIGASWCILLIFSYGPVYSLNNILAAANASFFLRDRWLLPIYNILLLLGLWILFRWRFETRGTTRILRTFAVVTFAVSLLLLLRAALETPKTPRHGTIAAVSAVNPKGEALKRDIYYLVFDRYADNATLRREFQFDNADFTHALRERGFHLAEQSYANYPKTEISMASALNMNYHGDTIAQLPHYRDLLEQHQVGRVFTAMGYRYYHLGCPLDGLRDNPQAASNYRFSRMPTEFAEMLFRMTSFYPYFPSTDVRTQSIQKFDALPQIAAQRGVPKFVYAHFLLPHNPWKFNRDGSLVTPAVAASRTEAENYIHQLVYTNTRVLETIDNILARSETPPVIILQADEGPELRYEGDQTKPEITKIRKRVGILSAFYLPGRQSDEPLPAGIGPVNTFRLVLQQYYDPQMTLLPEKSFYWDPATSLGKPVWSRTSRFIDVTARIQRSENTTRIATK